MSLTIAIAQRPPAKRRGWYHAVLERRREMSPSLMLLSSPRKTFRGFEEYEQSSRRTTLLQGAPIVLKHPCWLCGLVGMLVSVPPTHADHRDADVQTLA